MYEVFLGWITQNILLIIICSAAQKHVICWCVSRSWITFPQGYSAPYCQYSDKAIDDKNVKEKHPSFKPTLSLFHTQDVCPTIVDMTLQTE